MKKVIFGHELALTVMMLIVVSLSVSFAQGPLITSFSPTSGPVGTLVTISGSNFNPTASGNIVYFGGVKGVVSSATANSIVVAVPPGATYQPLTVRNFNRAGTSTTAFDVTFPGGVIDQRTFASRLIFLPFDSPRGLAVGDLDLDGKQDLVMTSANSSVVVFRNTHSSGTVSANSLVLAGDYPAPSEPIDVAIADIDGDGKLDLAVACQGSSYVTLYMNYNSTPGTISFLTLNIDMKTGNGIRGVALGDIDGDGKTDIVATNYLTHYISILRNVGSIGNTTVNSFETPVAYSTGANSSPRLISIGDLDQDGKSELVVANNGNHTVSIFKNAAVAGSKFNAGSFVPSTLSAGNGSGPIGIGIADLNGDYLPEVIVSCNSTDQISIFKNANTTSGVIQMSPKLDFPVGDAPRMFSIGDIDGDGKPDIAVPNTGSNSISVFRNTSSSPASISLDPKIDFATGIGPYGAVIADLDGDVRPELIETNVDGNSVSILRQPLQILGFNPASGPVGTTLTINGLNFSPLPINNQVFFGGAKANVTSATPIALTVIVPPEATFQSMTVRTDLLAASSSKPFNVSFSPVPLDPTTFATRISFTTANSPRGLAVGDLDQDGKLDLVTANGITPGSISYFKNLHTSGVFAASSFSGRGDLACPAATMDVAIGDINGDGWLDLVVASQDSEMISIFMNVTVPPLTGIRFNPRVDIDAKTGVGTRAVALADIDLDGRVDIVVTNYLTHQISIIQNVGLTGDISAGGFRTATVYSTGPNSSPRLAAIGDLDGDGKPEIAIANHDANKVSIFKNNTVPGFAFNQNSFTQTTLATDPGSGPIGVGIMDMDGDGFPEIAVSCNTSNEISIFRNTNTVIGTISFAAKVDIATGNEPRMFAIGDLDGDGKLDLAIPNTTSNTISVLRNSSSGVGSIAFDPKIDFVSGMGPYGVFIADMDGDNHPELIQTNTVGNSVSILRH